MDIKYYKNLELAISAAEVMISVESGNGDQIKKLIIFYLKEFKKIIDYGEQMKKSLTPEEVKEVSKIMKITNTEPKEADTNN